MRTKLVNSDAWNFAKLNQSLFYKNLPLNAVIPDKMGPGYFYFFFAWKEKSYRRHNLLERIMHAFDTFLFLQDGVTLAQNSPSWGGGGVSVSLVLFMH